MKLQLGFSVPDRKVLSRKKTTNIQANYMCKYKIKKRSPKFGTPYKKLAAAYFSTNKCSIIGDGGLNFSVRNGKR